MNRYNKVLIFLVLINLIAPIQAVASDKQVNAMQETVLTNLKSSRYSELLIALTVAGIGCGLFWYYCSGMFSIDERLLKAGPEMIEKMGKEIAELRSLVEDEAVALVNRNF